MSSSTVAPRRLRALAIVVAMVALTSVTGAGLASGASHTARVPHDAPQLTRVDLLSAVDAKVTSTTKHHLLLAFASDYQTSSTVVDARGSDSATENAHGMTVTLATGGTVGEEHNWYFPVPKNKLTYSATGRGKLAATSFGKYGRVKLSFQASGKTKTTTCSADDFVVTRYVSVRGTLLLNTHSKGRHRWGSVGSTHFRSTHRWQLVQAYGSGCYHFSKLTCVNGVNWSSGLATSSAAGYFGETSTFRGKHVGLIGADRTVTLSSPKGATRYDTVESVSPTPSYTEAPDQSQAVVVTTSGKTITGSAKLSNGAPSDPEIEKAPCTTSSGQAGTESDDSRDAAFVDSSLGLAAREQIFGTLRAPATSDGGIQHFTYSVGAPG